jgi:hypothetical protein
MLEADHFSPQLSPYHGRQFDQRVAFPEYPWPNLPEYDSSITTETAEMSPLTPCSYFSTSAGVSTCGEESQCDMSPEETHSGPKKKKRNRKPLTPTIALVSKSTSNAPCLRGCEMTLVSLLTWTAETACAEPGRTTCLPRTKRAEDQRARSPVCHSRADERGSEESV